MGFILGGQTCVDPKKLYAHCVKARLRTDHWYGVANSFINPLGLAPGTGKVLMSLASVIKLGVGLNPSIGISAPLLNAGVKGLGNNLSKSFPLTITDDQDGSVNIAKVYIVGHEMAVTPGADGDPNTTYLLEIADPRFFDWHRGFPKTKYYNLRTDADGTYINVTTQNGAGTPWTWQQMITDLWPLGQHAAPTLPFTPDGVPESFWFQNVSPFNAIENVLTRLCCAIRYNGASDTFEIVQKGDTKSANAKTALNPENLYLGNKKLYRRYDNVPVTPNVASFPSGLDVTFRVRAPYVDGTQPYTGINSDLTKPPTSTVPSVIITVDMQTLEDDLSALWDGISPGANPVFTNPTALTSRAAERSQHWLNKRIYHDTGEYREYVGIADLTPTLGCYYRAVGWEDRGRGYITSLAAGSNADRSVEDWKRHEYTDPVGVGGPVWGAPLIIWGPTSTPCCCGPVASNTATAGPTPPPSANSGMMQTLVATQFPPSGDMQTLIGTPIPPDGPPSTISPPAACGPNSHTVILNNGDISCAPNVQGSGGNQTDLPPNFGRNALSQMQGNFVGFQGGTWTFPAEVVGFQTLTNGDILVYDSTNPTGFSVISAGTSGQVVTSNGPGSLPTYQAASSGIAVVAHLDTVGLTTAQAPYLTYTPGADGIYELAATLVITGSGQTVTTNVAWTDPSGNTHSVSAPGINGTSALSVPGAYPLAASTINAKGGTAINITTALGAGIGVTYDLYASIIKIR